MKYFINNHIIFDAPDISEIIKKNEISFFPQTGLFRDFEAIWRPRLTNEQNLKEKMDAINPLFIPRNHRVEKSIQDAIRGNYASFHQLNDVLSNPFSDQPELVSYSMPPKEEEKITNTFCGT